MEKSRGGGQNGRLRVLLVEDDVDLRAAVRQLVQQVLPKAEIFEAGDGFTAGHLLGAHRPELVVLDVFLPDTDGLAICEKIRGTHELSACRILAMTGQGSVELEKQIRAAGADEYLPKPFQNAVFRDIVKRLAARVGEPRPPTR